MANSQLPPHIRQLVDKNNFVIAIKTLAQEQHISLDDAKNLIDEYENSKKMSVVHDTPTTSQNTVESLNQSLDNHLTQENIKLPLIPYWVKRVVIILIVVGLLGGLMWHTFG